MKRVAEAVTLNVSKMFAKESAINSSTRILDALDLENLLGHHSFLAHDKEQKP